MDEILQQILSQLNDLKSGQTGINIRLDKIDTRLDAMDARLDGIDTRLDAMDARLDGIDTRLDAMDARLDGIEQRVLKIEITQENIIIPRLNLLSEGISGINERLAKQDEIEAVQETHGHRIWALEQAVRG